MRRLRGFRERGPATNRLRDLRALLGRQRKLSRIFIYDKQLALFVSSKIVSSLITALNLTDFLYISIYL